MVMKMICDHCRDEVEMFKLVPIQAEKGWAYRYLCHPCAVTTGVESPSELNKWATTLKMWRKHHKLLQKEAASILSVPDDTYRAWECTRYTPAKHVRVGLYELMNSYRSEK